MNPLLKGFKGATKPPDRRTPWEWCEEHVVVDNTSPMPGRWRSDSSPWVKELMEDFQDSLVTDLSVMCSAQSSKTQTILNLLCWAISEDPGPAMWAMAAKDEAKTFLRDRVSPTFDKCDPVSRLSLGAEGMDYLFATMPLYFVGTHSSSKLQSKPIRYLFLDEVRNYPPGALETVLKRTRAFWNTKRVIISTPSIENDAVHRAFLAGDQRYYHFPCPKCSLWQQLKFTQETFKWVTNEQTKPNGKYDFDKLAETIHYKCENTECDQIWRDTPADRKYIARSGKFIATNRLAPRSKRSYTWNALLPPWVSWRSITEEYLNARHAARINGDLEALKTFYNESLGIPWKDELGVIEDFGFLEARKAEYDYGDVWAEAKRRFMSADKQESGGEHYWYVVREFGPNGKSRLITHGKANTKAELEQIRKDNKVAVGDAVIDSGYEGQEVYRFCVSTGWRPFKGDDGEFYVVSVQNPKNPDQIVNVRRIWRKTQAVVYNSATKARIGNIPLFTFCNDPTKDLLAEYLTGLVGDFTLPRKVDRDYLRQMTAERRMEKEDNKGAIKFFWKRVSKKNHYFDCELMILIAAIISKTINNPAPLVSA